MYIFQHVFLTNTQILDTRRTHALPREEVLRWKTLLWSDSPLNKSGQDTQKTSRPKQTETYILCRQPHREAGRQNENKLTVNCGVIRIQTVKWRILHHSSSRITRGISLATPDRNLKVTTYHANSMIKWSSRSFAIMSDIRQPSLCPYQQFSAWGSHNPVLRGNLIGT